MKQSARTRGNRASKFSVRFAERNRALDSAARIENSNLAGAKTRSGFGVTDCLIDGPENWLNAGGFKDFPS
jgi:hypothetical protein